MNTTDKKYSSRLLEVIAIIPARGGSKGLPNKNIIDLAGKPLIAYSILAAHFSRYIDRVVVSTEDEKIAHVARQWGADVPFLRPIEMAGDESKVSDAISYTINQLGGYNESRAFVILFPTSPFRTPVFIDQMLEILFNGYQSVTTVKEITVDPELLFIEDSRNQKRLVNLLEKNESIPSWKKYYRTYAAFHASICRLIEKHYYYVLKDKCMMIDIDTPKDLRCAESVIKNNLFDFGF